MEADAWPVTHVFTDLEGSTSLWESEPVRMQAALDRHDALAREIVERERGRLVKMTGDGVYATFDDPLDAVHASSAFARQLAVLSRETGLPLRARLGLHAGDAQARDGDYYGRTVNRAARIMSAAHGGQVLLSEAVAVMVRDRLSDEFTLRAIGRVRLRDLAQPEQIFQLIHVDMDSQFPPLRTLDSTPNNLPQQTSSFIGRDGAIAELRGMLAKHRLLTLTGPGGIGKTRLALQLAAELLDEHTDGIWFVDFAPLADPKLVVESVARVLRVAEHPGEPLSSSIAHFLGSRNVLLILDNCEHVAAAAATLIDGCLRGAPGLRVVATTREVLRIPGERLYPVPPLSIPQASETDLEVVRRHAGLALFVERAMEHQPSFELTSRNLNAVIFICRELDGMPLALELAAARVRSLPIEEIAARLRDRFRLLATGSRVAVPRHQTLAALVAWSHNLLDETERALFRRLATFAGGFDLASAQAVCGFEPLDEASVVDILGGLVDKSLVTATMEFDYGHVIPGADASPPDRAGPVGRYTMLETIRAFAQEQLQRGEDAQHVAEGHSRYFLALATRADDEIRGPRKPYWCARLAADHDNLRAAMRHALGEDANSESALRFGVKLAAFWRFQGHATEGRAYLRAVLSRPALERFPRSHAGAMMEGGILASFQGDNDEARTLGEASLALYRQLERKSEQSSALIMLGVVLQSSGAFDKARDCHAEALALARELNAKAPQAICLVNLAELDLRQGDAGAARAGLLHALDVLRESGEGTASIYAHEMLGQIDLRTGALPSALERFQHARALAQRTGDVMQQAKTTMLAGRTELALGREASGWQQLGEGIARLHQLAQKEETLLALDLAAEALQTNDMPLATKLRAATSAARAQYRFQWPLLDRAAFERDEREADATLDERMAAKLRAAGAAWSLQEAVGAVLAHIRGAGRQAGA